MTQTHLTLTTTADQMSPEPFLKAGTFIDLNIDAQEEEETLNEQEAQDGIVEHTEPNQVEPHKLGDDKLQLNMPPLANILNYTDGLVSMPVAETTDLSLPHQCLERGPLVAKVSPALAERPKWLPENWLIDSRVRLSGATAGLIDRYYVEPVKGHRFRSKKEVLHFLETGSTRKRKQNPDADVLSPENPGAHKQKKSGSKLKKSAPFDPLKFDFDKVPEEVSWVLTDASQGIWTPFLGDKQVSESNKQEWAAAFDYLNTKKTH